VLFFELFPAVFAIVALIVGIVLFEVNRRAQNDPDAEELPRTPSQPSSAAEGSTPPAQNNRRPSMRA
jgi:hypothetical protein